MARRRVSNPLALAVLALLQERPMHPYEISRTLRERYKEFSIRLNYGSLYSVVEKLARRGLIEARETVREGRRPERTIYASTAAGRAEFEDWLSELLSTPQKEYPRFEAGLSLMSGLPPDEVADLLEQRCRQLELDLVSSEAALRNRPPELKRLLIIEWEYVYAMWRAELEWTRDLVREIRDGTLDGIEEWRTMHGQAGPQDGTSTQAGPQDGTSSEEGADDGVATSESAASEPTATESAAESATGPTAGAADDRSSRLASGTTGRAATRRSRSR